MGRLAAVGTAWLIVLSTVLLATTSPVGASTQPVPTPTGTMYVVHDADTQPPEGRTWSPICITGVYCLACYDCWPTDLGHARAEAGLWTEANGCEGLQTEPVDCRGDEAVEPADERIVHAADGVDP